MEISLKKIGIKMVMLSIALSVLSLIFVPKHSFAADNNVAPMQIEQEAGTISPQNTVSGDGGKSWVYLNYVNHLTSQTSMGAKSSVGNMLLVNWLLTYSTGKTASGTDTPFNSTWKSTHIKNYASTGWKGVVLSGTAHTWNMNLVLLNPSDSVYVY